MIGRTKTAVAHDGNGSHGRTESKADTDDQKW